MMGYSIYIGVGLSALLGQTDRAMREPSGCGPGTELAPRFSCVYDGNINGYNKLLKNCHKYEEEIVSN